MFVVFCSYFSLVDGLRKAPSSFAHLTYHSQIIYQLTSKDQQRFAARFRLIPADQQDYPNGSSDGGRGGIDSKEKDNHDVRHRREGLLTPTEQEQPWCTGRRDGDHQKSDYLREEFLARLREDEPVTYQLQIQLRSDVDDWQAWHPQLVCNCQVNSAAFHPSAVD